MYRFRSPLLGGATMPDRPGNLKGGQFRWSGGAGRLSAFRVDRACDDGYPGWRPIALRPGASRHVRTASGRRRHWVWRRGVQVAAAIGCQPGVRHRSSVDTECRIADQGAAAPSEIATLEVPGLSGIVAPANQGERNRSFMKIRIPRERRPNEARGAVSADT